MESNKSHSLFRVSGKDIAKLDDDDLKTLIGLLCEAEVKTKGISSQGVLWGGHQDAPDGAVDVLVDIPSQIQGYIPSSYTVFQVKKHTMSASRIEKEMKPKGKLKPIFHEIAERNGAYIIVSPKNSTTKTARESRLNSMRSALSEIENSKNISIDFYDQQRIASWVSNHPFAILWVHEKLGKLFQGWKAFGNWSNSSTENDTYLTHDSLKILSPGYSEEGISIIEGLNKIRSSLKKDRTSIRLTGLSGVGKTRFVQALFEEEAGENHIDPDLAIYTDISHSPEPTPVAMAEALVSQNVKAILVIDNCRPDLHTSLTAICKRAKSQLSLITVEYDVREDLPSETDVYKIEPCGTELIEELLKKLFPHILPINTHQIASFVGGNFRCALALGSTFDISENVSELKDKALFERLFFQGDKKIVNDSLLQTAKGCSVVYSFDGEDFSARSEIEVLSKLTRQDPIEIFKNVKELKNRNLVQERSKWRAVLPHVIANKLAREFLEENPPKLVSEIILESDNKRLIKSFSKRLSYLHDSGPASDIANSWISKDGWLSELSRLDDFDKEVFENIVPITLEAALSAYVRIYQSQDDSEVFFSESNPNLSFHFDVLRSLAYDIEYYDKVMPMLIIISLTEPPSEEKNKHDSIRERLRSMFKTYFSGTLAPPEKRLEVIDSLINSEDENRVVLGLDLLNAALETNHFIGWHIKEFGARSRGYGIYPEKLKGKTNWYKSYYDYFLNFPNGKSACQGRIKATLEDNISGLYAYTGLVNEMPILLRKYANGQYWLGGYRAMNFLLNTYEEELDMQIASDIRAMRLEFSPKTINDRINTFLAGNKNYDYDLVYDGSESDRNIKREKLGEVILSLGAELAEHELLQDILEDDFGNSESAFIFSKGLYQGAQEPQIVWSLLKATLRKRPESKTCIALVCGYIFQAFHKKEQHLDKWLSEILDDPIFHDNYTWIECSKPLNDNAVHRLRKATTFDTVPIESFKSVAYGRVHETLNDKGIFSLCSAIRQVQGGHTAILEIIYFRTFDNEISSDLKNLAKESFLKVEFEDEEDRSDHRFAGLAKKVFEENEDYGLVFELSRKLRISMFKEIWPTRLDFDDFAFEVSKANPVAFLDGFLLHKNRGISPRGYMFKASKNPVMNISEAIRKQWVAEDPYTRYPLIFSLIDVFQYSDNGPDWKNEVYQALDLEGDLSEILRIILVSTDSRESNWGGDNYKLKIDLLDRLITHKNSQVVSWSRETKIELQGYLERQLKRREENERSKNESFE